MSIDAYAVYTVFKSDAELKKEAEAKAASGIAGAIGAVIIDDKKTKKKKRKFYLALFLLL